MSDNSLQINVGKQIQKLRELKGISQQDLAAKCNFEKSNMSRLEAGRVNPTLSTLEKIANALQVTLAEIVTFN
jgi:transcriptional regulator with XRE-family HTH domain|nr:helix-turn-helix transcriptional regulator [uncultured Flavobacterium sp.]